MATLVIPSPGRSQTTAGTGDPCVLADALREAGAAKPATREYVALLRRDPALDCAKRGLAEINRPPPDTAARDARRLCARGDAYRAVHREADALAAYKSALEKNPAARCAR
ncbi:MAG: hypothetical protein M3141_10480, partial [Actinomycetota bacterium]|nr:hypothetical protein [Actinomycetota bacterium]